MELGHGLLHAPLPFLCAGQILDRRRFEVLVEIGSATGHGSSVNGYLGMDAFSSPQVEQETNSLLGELLRRLPRLSCFRAQFLVQFPR